MTSAREILDAHAARVRAPTAATMVVTDRCNYDCAHCYQPHDEKPAELTLDEIVRIMRELADVGVLFLVLMGGEFFMRRDADEILRHAHELGFAIRLKTTGHFVTDKRADFIATLRPIEVDLSVYAAGRHAHEAVTRQPGSWQRTIDAARRLVARKVNVVLRCSLMQSNAGEVTALRALAAEMGTQISFDPKIQAREDSTLEPLALRMDADTLHTLYGDALHGDLKQRDAPDDQAPCGAASRGVGIDPQGKVWPCNVLPLPAGDLRQQSFRDIWYGSETLQEVRGLTWAKLSECNRCEVRSYCSRCHAMALLEHGDMHGPSLEACRHAVATRDALRARGLVPETDTALPPTWDRIDPDGQHEQRRRPLALRVLP